MVVKSDETKCKPAKVMGVEFGEAVVWKRKPSGGALGQLSRLWDSKGGRTTRSIQRKPVEDRWPATSAEMIFGVLWPGSDEDPEVDDEDMQVTKLEPQMAGTPSRNRLPSLFHHPHILHTHMSCSDAMWLMHHV